MNNTMRVLFSFDDNEFLNDMLSFGGEWKLPFLPRIGEIISPAMLVDWITPNQLFDALTDYEKSMWLRWVSEDVEAGSQEDEAQLDNLYIWLANLGSVVSEICWSKYEEEPCVMITLKR